MNPLDQLALADLPGGAGDVAREEIAQPVRGSTESYDQAANRYAAEEQANRQVQRVRAEDFANRKIPTYSDETGNVQPVRDSSGAALTGYDKSSSTAWDSLGQPLKIQYGETGPPKTSDPFAGLADTVDPKTGNKYQIAPGLPWKYTGIDPKAKAAADRAAVDKELQQTAAAQGTLNTLDQAQQKFGESAYKQQRKQLVGIVPTLATPDMQDADRDATVQHISDHFDAQLKSPEATATAGWFSKDLSPEAQQLQTQITNRKAAALQKANDVFDLRDRLDQQQAIIDRNQATRAAMLRARYNDLSGNLVNGIQGGLYGIDEKTREPLLNALQPADAMQQAEQDGTAQFTPEQKQQAQLAQTRFSAIEAAKSGQKPYQISADGKQFTPSTVKPFDSLSQAAADGVIENPPQTVLDAAKKAQDVLDKLTPAQQQLMAAGKGLGIGAAFAAGAGPGADAGGALGAFGGPLAEVTVPIGAVIGGLATGSLSAFAAKKAMDAIGTVSNFVNQVNVSAQAHPITSSVSEMVGGIGQSGAKSILNLTRLAQIASEDGGKLAATKVIGAKLAQGAAGGAAFEGLVRPAFDHAVATAQDAMGIDHDQVENPSMKSLLTWAGIGALTAFHNVEFKDWSSDDIASVLARAKVRNDAGIKLNDDDPAKVAQAFKDKGIDLDSQQFAQWSKPLTPEEIALHGKLAEKVKAMQDSGLFDNAIGARFKGATQASVPTRKGNIPFFTSDIEPIQGEDGASGRGELPGPPGESPTDGAGGGQTQATPASPGETPQPGAETGAQPATRQTPEAQAEGSGAATEGASIRNNTGNIGKAPTLENGTVTEHDGGEIHVDGGDWQAVRNGVVVAEGTEAGGKGKPAAASAFAAGRAALDANPSNATGENTEIQESGPVENQISQKPSPQPTGPQLSRPIEQGDSIRDSNGNRYAVHSLDDQNVNLVPEGHTEPIRIPREVMEQKISNNEVSLEKGQPNAATNPGQEPTNDLGQHSGTPSGEHLQPNEAQSGEGESEQAGGGHRPVERAAKSETGQKEAAQSAERPAVAEAPAEPTAIAKRRGATPNAQNLEFGTAGKIGVFFPDAIHEADFKAGGSPEASPDQKRYRAEVMHGARTALSNGEVGYHAPKLELAPHTPADARKAVHETLKNREGKMRVQFAEGDTGSESGAVARNGKIVIDPKKLAEQMDAIRAAQREKGIAGTPEEAVHSIIDEEITHVGQMKLAENEGTTWQEKYLKLANSEDLPKDWYAAVQEARPKTFGKSFDDLSGNEKAQAAAEFERMVLQGKWKGTITEAFFRQLKAVVDYLKQVAKTGSEAFRKGVERLEKTLAGLHVEEPSESAEPLATRETSEREVEAPATPHAETEPPKQVSKSVSKEASTTEASPKVNAKLESEPVTALPEDTQSLIEREQVKYDGKIDYGTRTLYQFTDRLESSPAHKATFTSKSLNADAVKDKLAEVRGRFAEQLESEPAFYSAVERTAETKLPNKATGDQMLKTLQNSPGVKNEEMEWMGIPQFLQGKDSVTKQELLGHIRANSVKLNEVTKGEPTKLQMSGFGWRESTRNSSGLKMYTLGSEMEGQPLLGLVGAPDEQRNVAYIFEMPDGSFDLEGGDASERDQEEIGSFNTIEEAKNKAEELIPKDASVTVDNPTKFSQYKTPGGENYKERLLTLPTNVDSPRLDELRDNENRTPEEEAEFQRELKSGQSTHWDEPNIIAHTREQDFTDTEGKKVRLLEEIQSDWHQKGRKEGYDNEAAFQKLLDQKKAAPDDSPEQDAIQRQIDEMAKSGNKGMPDAPFKKEWPLLAFKNSLTHAVDDGADKIAWVTGETAADRFDLSKQVRQITYHGPGRVEREGETPGARQLVGFDHHGREVLTKNVAPSELPDVIGKDAAKRLLESPVKLGEWAGSQRHTFQTIEGDNLKVGGEGMKGFYDDILPKMIGKYVKPWGGKVEKSTIGGGGDFDTWFESNYGSKSDYDDAQIRAAKGEFDSTRNTSTPKHEVHSITITPQMRSAVQQGQTLFSESALGDYVREDIAPIVKGAGLSFQELMRGATGLIAPITLASHDIADAFHRFKGEQDKALYLTQRATAAAEKWFTRAGQQENIDFIDRYKRGEKQKTPDLDAVAEMIREIDTATWNEAQQAYKDAGFKDADIPLAWLENHLRVLWKIIPGSKDEKGNPGLFGKGPLSGSKGMLKQHTLPDISTGLEMGGVPYSYNPLTLLRRAQADLHKLIGALHMMTFMRKHGFAVFARSAFPKLQDGFKWVDDPMFKNYFPASSGEGLIAGGRWMIEENAARLLQNYLSRDFVRESNTGKGLMFLKNVMTEAELALSPFHAVAMTLEAAGSTIGQGLQKIYNRGMLHASPTAAFEGLMDIAKGLTGITPAVTATQEGSAAKRLIAEKNFRNTKSGKALLKQFPNADYLVHLAFMGGMKLDEPDWKSQSLKVFTEAAANIAHGDTGAANWIRATLRAVPAMNELLMSPLFDHFIPNLKLGMFMREMTEALKTNNGALTDETLARQTWRFVEDRFGEVNFDNLWWNRTFKSAAQLMFRSVTWKAGSISAIGGAFGGQAKEFMDAVKEGRAPVLHRKFAWLLGLCVMTAAFSYVMQKALTGKDPQSLADLTDPQIDPKDPKVRISMPTYVKDLIHIAHSPTAYISSSLSGWIGKMAEIWKNKDFYGTKVYNEDDSLAQKATDISKHLAGGFLPFSVRGYKNLSDQQVSAVRKVLPMLGLTPAPKYITQTDAEKLAEKFAEGHREEGGRTKEQADKSLRNYQASQQLRHGQPLVGPIFDSMKPTEVKAAQKRATMSPLAYTVQHLPTDEAMKVYRQANATEKDELAPIIASRIKHNPDAASTGIFNGF